MKEEGGNKGERGKERKEINIYICFILFIKLLLFFLTKVYKTRCYTLLYSRWRDAPINAGLRSAIKLKEEEEDHLIYTSRLI